MERIISSVNQIVARIKTNGKYVAAYVVCENCKEKFENDELLKCEMWKITN